jgi:thiol-disulfide isomerase/thioredoxin
MHTWDVTQGGAGVKRALEQQFGITKGENTEIFIGDYALAGSHEIETRLPLLIDEYLAQGGVALVMPKVTALPTATPTAMSSSALVPTPVESASAQTAVVRAVLFWSKTCPHCHEVIDNVLPPLQDRYGHRLDIRMLELSDPANQQLFEAALDAFRVPLERSGVPFLIVGDRVMVGSLEIPEQLPALIEKHLAAGGVGWPRIPGLEQVVDVQAATTSPAPTGPAAMLTQLPTPAGRVAATEPTVAPAPDPSACTLTTPCADATATRSPLSTALATPAPTAHAGIAVVRAVMFWMEGCPHCHAVIEEVLPPLQRKYAEQLDIRLIEVKTAEDVERLYQASAEWGIPRQNVAVPLLVIGNRVLIGSAQIPAELPGLIEQYLAAGGVGFPRWAGFSDGLPVDSAKGGGPALVEPTTSFRERHVVDLPFFGEVDLDAHSLTFSTVLIGFLDGVNPCSLWVISLLLALVVNTGSRRKTVLVGLTFLAVAAALYALIILGLFSVFAFIGYALWIRLGVALIALTFAVVNIKDYFWYKEGPSFTIADEHKPGIYRDIRRILAQDKSSLALIGATATMAFGVTLIEMPCTAGLPILWTKLITANQVGLLSFVLLLGLYLLMYLLDEMVVFTSAVVTLRASRLEEKQGRILKLIGGIVMLALALVLLIDPTWMDSLANSLLVFGGAFVAALLVLLAHRQILPRWGIVIGTEDAVKVPSNSKPK